LRNNKSGKHRKTEAAAYGDTMIMIIIVISCCFVPSLS